MEELPVVTRKPLECLKEDAIDALRRTLYMSDDKKTVVGVATKILDSLRDEVDTQRPIVIKDSQIQILVQVAREALGG